MSTATITCPRCSSSLRTTQPFEEGSRFRCPGCGCTFAAGTQVGLPAAVGGLRPLPPGGDDDVPHNSHGWTVLIGVVGLAVLLLVGAGAILAVKFLPQRDKAPVAEAPAPETPAPPSADPSVPPPADAPAAVPDKKDAPKRRPKPVVLSSGDPPSLTPPEPSVQSVLPPDEQQKVNKAIERGVEWLRKTQQQDGSWAQAHAVGLAALPGLTLLECGVPADDEQVVKAAEYVRRKAPMLGKTYELGLAILFLDRLGDEQDEPLIRSMALRLIAGQTAAGGWSYDCPIVKEKDEQQLFKILQTTRPRLSMDLTMTKSGGKGIDDLITSRTPNKPDRQTGGPTPPSGPTEEDVNEAKKLYDKLPAGLKDIPALKPPIPEEQMPGWDNSDNSNTQFATLGLWAAGRHGVPMERALARLAQRFQVSQTPNGAWCYHYQPHPDGGETASMTGAGLLGLGVGHGVTVDLKGADIAAAGEDRQVEKGMMYLSEHIAARRNGSRALNTYLLWSIERVGMLYGRKTIGDKEWYPVGAAELVDHQNDDGSWPQKYEKPTDTCLALLFLKRANLAKDLSTKLRFLTQVKQP
ncbi:MAG TPA: prenyltransferase/squalene oxidase repeat-containing protein [Gemmataceae bacterium]|nr:prenyltransferase/squalene oxidase repeat-containing protein [Gemmataceae bacterium]